MADHIFDLAAPAASDIGPHLLGRIPSTPDDRNYPLSAFMRSGAPPASPLDVALAAALPHHTTKMQEWMRQVTAAAQGDTPAPPVPVPTPTPGPAGATHWLDSAQLDQGQTGHCVGFGWAQWGNTLPIDDRFGDTDGHTIYYAAKVIDGEPNAEDGSSVHSGAIAMRDRGRIDAYAWASSVDEVIAWITTHGPVVVGTDWYDGMFNPDASGLVKPTGSVAGGHCYVCLGYDPTVDTLAFQNSWGASWGVDGYFAIAVSDFAALLDAQGEACVGLEV